MGKVKSNLDSDSACKPCINRNGVIFHPRMFARAAGKGKIAIPLGTQLPENIYPAQIIPLPLDRTDVLGDCIDKPSVLVIIQVVWRYSSQNGILLLVVRNCAITCSVQAVCNGFTDMFAFKVGALQIAEEFLAGGLACEKQIAYIRTKVLMRLHTGRGRPVGV
mgnify:CR=1 FL=1